MRSEAATQRQPANVVTLATKLLWWLLIASGIAFRFVGLNWDEGAHLHPDERFLTLVIPQLQWPQHLTQYFHSAQSPLNPLNLPDVELFVYGQLPLFVAKAVATWRGQDNYDGLLLVGRFLSALVDSGSVLLLYLVARRVSDGVVARIAALLLAFTALHLQHAHFFVVDTFATFFVLLSFLCILLWWDVTTDFQTVNNIKVLWRAICAGMAWGLALACKISTLLWLPIILLIFALALWRANVQLKSRRIIGISLLLCLCAAFMSFRIAHPLAFRGEPTAYNMAGLLDVRLATGFWQSLQEQYFITSGQRDIPFNVQWIGRQHYLYPLRNLGGWALGWPLLMAAIGGVVWLGWRYLRRLSVPVGMSISAVWVVCYFLYHAGQFSKFTRYYLLTTPFMALLAAWFLVEMWRWAQQSQSKYFRSAAAALFGLTMATTVSWGSAVASIYTQPQPRLEASRWINTSIPYATTICRSAGR
jgi:4-amino-4-deoxy-L-arabinose transferase-like glycosyltransferase